MQKESHRLSRIETQLMRKVAVLIEQELEDPRIKNVTISRVIISPDLYHARIYFTVFLEKDSIIIKKITHALNHSVSYLRRRLAENLALRITPELFFIYDASLEKTHYLLELINKVNPDSDTPSHD